MLAYKAFVAVGSGQVPHVPNELPTPVPEVDATELARSRSQAEDSSEANDMSDPVMKKLCSKGSDGKEEQLAASGYTDSGFRWIPSSWTAVQTDTQNEAFTDAVSDEGCDTCQEEEGADRKLVISQESVGVTKLASRLGVHVAPPLSTNELQSMAQMKQHVFSAWAGSDSKSMPFNEVLFMSEFLGLRQLPGMASNAWKLPIDDNPLRFHFYKAKQMVMVKSAMPVTATHVRQVVRHVSSKIQNKFGADILQQLLFSVNTGTHGDALGEHAEPDVNASYVEPQFLAEDMQMAATVTDANVSVVNMPTEGRLVPAEAVMVIDAFCFSGRKHHTTWQPGDPRTFENVELVQYVDKAPSLRSDAWDSVVEVKHMSLEAASRVLRESPGIGALYFVRGTDNFNGVRVPRGKFAGTLLTDQTAVFFEDGFSYEFSTVPAGKDAVTITKEPHLMLPGEHRRAGFLCFMRRGKNCVPPKRSAASSWHAS